MKLKPQVLPVLWSADNAAEVTKGLACGQWSVSGLSIDTRSLNEGDLFIPLSDVRDGHDFIPMAYEKGAAAVMSVPQIQDAPALIVDDPMLALTDLAHGARERSSAIRIGVTGSVGKTSVKDMIAHIAAQFGPTHKSKRSFNNHWGVPLTMASMPEVTKFGVFEMGMNHVGELSDLTKIIQPNIAIITTIAAAHLAHFSNVGQIARAKSEIFEGLTKGGIAILPYYTEHSELLELAAQKHGAKTYRFGTQEGAEAQISDITLKPRSSKFKLTIENKTVLVDLPMAGAHSVENGACALLCAFHMGIDLRAAAKALQTMGKISGRGAIHDLTIEGHDFILVDESYNANPKSMRAALESFALHPGRKAVILGDMHELGRDELPLHAGLMDPVLACEPDFVICCGERMKALFAALNKMVGSANKTYGGHCPKIIVCDHHHQAESEVLSALGEIDLVLIKGSNASGMGKIVANLLTHHQQGIEALGMENTKKSIRSTDAIAIKKHQGVL